MKRIFLSALAAAMLAVPMFAGSAHAAKSFNGISFQSEYFERHPTTVKVFKPFFAAAKEQFQGKLSFDYFTQGALFPPAEAFSAVSDGRVDFGNIRPSRFPGKLNLLGVCDIPGMCPNSIVGSLVAFDLIQKFEEIRREMPANTVTFTTWASAPYQLHSSKPIRSLADIKSLKCVVWDAPTMEVMKKFGANPIRLDSHDTYLALSKGMAEAVLCPLAPVRSIKITDICTNHYIMDLGTSNFIELANKDVWEAFPADMRAWLEAQGGRKMALDAALSLDGGAQADARWMKEQGHTFVTMTPEDRAAMIAALQPLADEWVAATSKIFPAELVKAVFDYARERSAFYQKEVASGKYGDFSL